MTQVPQIGDFVRYVPGSGGYPFEDVAVFTGHLNGVPRIDFVRGAFAAMPIECLEPYEIPGVDTALALRFRNADPEFHKDVFGDWRPTS